VTNFCHIHQRKTNTPVAKRVSRISLFCTSDTPVFEVTKEDCCEIPDFFGSDGKLTTDGSGLISVELSRAVLARLSEYRDDDALANGIYLGVSAFQIRLGGMKGVLEVDTAGILPPGKSIGFRLSMVKCRSDDTMLCVVGTSRYQPLYLAHESVNLLTSLEYEASKRGIDFYPSSAIYHLQEKMLDDCVSMFLDEDEAVKAMCEYGSDGTQAVQAGFNILVEPMWLSQLHAIYEAKMVELRTKAHIFVEKGCMLVGVPDTTRSLKAGEVFIQIQPRITSPATIIPVIIPGIWYS
jgi:RNA-dependent RNA polymerase